LERKSSERVTGVVQMVTSSKTARVNLCEEDMGRVKLMLSLEVTLTLIVMKLLLHQSD